MCRTRLIVDRFARMHRSGKAREMRVEIRAKCCCLGRALWKDQVWNHPLTIAVKGAGPSIRKTRRSDATGFISFVRELNDESG